MPFVKTGNAHGDTLPAEDHAAFNLCLAAHVEGAGGGEFCPEGGNNLCIYTCTNKNFGAALGIPEFQKLSDGFFSRGAVG